MLKELKKVRDTEALSRLLAKWRKTPVSEYIKGNNLLHLAVYTGDLNVVKIAYEILRDCNLHKKALNKQNLKGRTPEVLAYQLSFLDIYLWLQKPEEYRRIKNPRPDYWADFFRNLESAKVNVKSNWVTYKGTEVKLRKQVAHYRGSVIKKSLMFAKEIGVTYDVKVPRFLTTPIRWYHRLYNNLSFVFEKQIKAYPWKFFEINRPNPHVTCDYIIIDSEVGRKLKDKARAEKSNVLALFCALCDEVFQEELLTKKVNTFNFLTLNYTQVPEPRPAYHTELSFLPMKIKKIKKIKNKSKALASQLKWGIFWKKFLRVDQEIQFFNHFFRNNPARIKKILSGEISRFVTYSYFGDYRVDEETYQHEFIGLGRSNPLGKISLAFHFKNDQLVLSLDIHPQILEDRSSSQIILQKIKTRIEEYVKD